VIEGIDDDSATPRRYRLELTEEEYHDAVRTTCQCPSPRPKPP
jgi:hypothetical protein